MGAESTDVSGDRYGTVFAVVIAIVLLTVVFMYFRDRQQRRSLELRRFNTQMELLQEWELPVQNRQPNNAPRGEGKIP